MKYAPFALLLLLGGCRTNVPANAPRPPTPPGAADTMSVHMIDVGQGSATLVEFGCGAALIDTGGETSHQFDSGARLKHYLERFFERRPDLNRTLDLVVLTHPHLDHTRNVQLVLETFNVKNLLTDGGSRGSGSKQQEWAETWARAHAQLEVVKVASIPAGGKTDAVIDPVACTPIDPRISVLWGGLDEKPGAWSQRAYGNHNNQSVVVRIEYGRASLLVNGDLEEAGIDALLAKHEATPALDADLWQVGHHGSYNATTEAMLRALTPRIALIPMGSPERWSKWTAWQYGHPRKKAVDRLVSAVSDARPAVEVLVGTAVETFEKQTLDRAIYGTGWDGDIVVTATADGTYRVATEHPVRATTGIPAP